ncbi:MAG: hypothetical protein DCC75_06410, partial [Proteobacteria bacterium]
MKAGHILAAAISGVVLLQAACAAGDEGDIRRLIMEDCSAAKAHALQLPADQKPQLVQHLILVLKLRQQVPVDVAASGPSLGLSLDDLRALEVSRSFQPGRENEAKRCAIEILDAFGEISAAALPAMAGTHSDRTLPEDLAFSIEVAAYSIAQAVSAGSMQIGQEPARELVQFSPASYLARNLLYDLQAKYVDPILNLLQNSNDNERGILVDVLSNFDGQEQKIGEKALQIYQGAGPELKGSIIELASRLAGLHQNFFAIFVYEATTSGSGLADKADRALEGVLEQSSQIICEPASILNLVQAFKSQREGDRELYARVLEKACAGQEAVEAPILEIVSDRSAPLKLRVRSLRILVAPGEVSERTATKLLDLASDSEVELRLAAIEALGLAKNRKAEATRLLLKILKSNAKESDVLARQQVLLSAVASLALLGADLEPQTIMPYIVEGLAIEESHPDLVRRLSTLRDFVVKFFSNSGKGSLQS